MLDKTILKNLTGHVTRVIHFHVALKAEASYFNAPYQAKEGKGFTILPRGTLDLLLPTSITRAQGPPSSWSLTQ